MEENREKYLKEIAEIINMTTTINDTQKIIIAIILEKMYIQGMQKGREEAYEFTKTLLNKYGK